ncbi:hypothetical protein Ocin01_07181 [Orchesella cincta]|uniref:Uncharacterized protein n=1 Tax=Orchesella cincta TaxID=48709 RepID=A0A1D2N2M1_ORCCI|nr:hypothetical protein Ocin01_07181 [Orchesella cincta]
MSQPRPNNNAFAKTENMTKIGDSNHDQGSDSGVLGFEARGVSHPVNYHFHGNNHYLHFHMPIFSNNNIFELPPHVEQELQAPVIYGQVMPVTSTGYDNNLEQFRYAQRQHHLRASGLTHLNMSMNDERLMGSPSDLNLTFPPAMSQIPRCGHGHGAFQTASQPSLSSGARGQGNATHGQLQVLHFRNFEHGLPNCYRNCLFSVTEGRQLLAFMFLLALMRLVVDFNSFNV